MSTQTLEKLDASLPSVEYKVTFSDGSVTPLSVHPGESLMESLSGMLTSAGTNPTEVSSVEINRTFDLEEEHPEVSSEG
jgi:hypothetical protein